MRPRTKTLALAILAAAAIGGITLVAIVAPNAFQVLGRRHRRDDWWTRREAERRRIQEALERLRRRRLVRYDERGKETYITVTADGKAYLRRFEFDEMTLERPEHWDTKWRVIMFDIPERSARERKTFRDKLKDLGFHQLQKSIWVFPHECRDEVDFITRFLNINRFVLYLETPLLDHHEGKTRIHFNLL